MARFLLIFRGGAVVRPELTSDDRERQVGKWNEWSRALMAAGQYVPGGQPLDSAGRTLRGADRTIADGPHGRSAELVTGTYLLEAPSLDAAAEIARGCPILDVDGSVEVRPILNRPE